MKRLGTFVFPHEGMLVHSQVTTPQLGFPNNSTVAIYAPGWREAVKVKRLAQENRHSVPGQRSNTGPFLESSGNFFRPVKLFSVHLYLKAESVYSWNFFSYEGSFCLKWIKQLCNHRARDFSMAVWAAKMFLEPLDPGTSALTVRPGRSVTVFGVIWENENGSLLR